MRLHKICISQLQSLGHTSKNVADISLFNSGLGVIISETSKTFWKVCRYGLDLRNTELCHINTCKVTRGAQISMKVQ